MQRCGRQFLLRSSTCGFELNCYEPRQSTEGDKTGPVSVETGLLDDDDGGSSTKDTRNSSAGGRGFVRENRGK